MNKQDLPLIIVDSCCFVAFFTQTNKDQAERVYEILEEHEKTHRVALPAVILLETLGKSQMGTSGSAGSNHEHRRKKFTEARTWIESQGYVPVNLDHYLVTEALELIYTYGLHGMDASIVAAAITYGAETIYTFDKKMLKVNNKIEGVNIIEPPPTSKLFTTIPH